MGMATVDVMMMRPFPRLRSLPATLPREGAVHIELEEGIPVFRASTSTATRIEELLFQQQETLLTAKEEKELDQYEEVDDYLSFVNRLVRNVIQVGRSK